MNRVVVARINEFGTHSQKRLSWGAEDVSALQVLYHERQRDVIRHEYLHLVIFQILVTQIIRVGDVKVERVAMIIDGVCLAELNAQAVVARQHIVESFQLLTLSTGNEKEKQ